MIQHIVLFTPKAGLDDASLRLFATSVTSAVRAIPSVRRATVGRHVVVNAGYERTLGDKTYEFAAVVEFDDEAGLLDYLNHPLHREVGRLFWEHCASSVICEVKCADIDDRAQLAGLWRTT